MMFFSILFSFRAWIIIESVKFFVVILVYLNFDCCCPSGPEISNLFWLRGWIDDTNLLSWWLLIFLQYLRPQISILVLMMKYPVEDLLCIIFPVTRWTLRKQFHCPHLPMNMGVMVLREVDLLAIWQIPNLSQHGIKFWNLPCSRINLY